MVALLKSLNKFPLVAIVSQVVARWLLRYLGGYYVAAKLLIHGCNGRVNQDCYVLELYRLYQQIQVLFSI